MKKPIFLGVLLVSLIPSVAFARCSAQGYTVGYINGVWTTRAEAEADEQALVRAYTAYTPADPKNPVSFITIYNPTHLAGAGDIAESVSQVFGSPISDFDFTTMLQQLYPELQTRRVLLLGHSQGALYANSLYAYFLSHAEPREAVGVYAVGTPASFVAGGGRYLNAKNDIALTLVTEAAQKVGAPLPLAPNIDIDLIPADFTKNTFEGHSFADAYIAGAPERIASDVSASLSKLVPTYASEYGDCFDPPPQTLTHTLEQALFFVADPVANAAVGAVSGVANSCHS